MNKDNGMNTNSDIYKKYNFIKNREQIMNRHNFTDEELRSKLMSLLCDNQETPPFSNGDVHNLSNHFEDFKNARNTQIQNIQNSVPFSVSNYGAENWGPFIDDYDSFRNAEPRNYLQQMQQKIQINENWRNAGNNIWNRNNDTDHYKCNGQWDQFVMKKSEGMLSDPSHIMNTTDISNIGTTDISNIGMILNQSNMATSIPQDMTTFNISDKERDQNDDTIIMDNQYKTHGRNINEDGTQSIYDRHGFFSEINNNNDKLTKEKELNTLIDNMQRMHISNEQQQQINNSFKITDNEPYSNEQFHAEYAENTKTETDSVVYMPTLEPNYISGNEMSISNDQEQLYNPNPSPDVFNKNMNYNLFYSGDKNYKRMFNTCFLNSWRTSIVEDTQSGNRNETGMNSENDSQQKYKFIQENKAVTERNSIGSWGMFETSASDNGYLHDANNQMNIKKDMETVNRITDNEMNKMHITSNTKFSVENGNMEQNNNAPCENMRNQNHGVDIGNDNNDCNNENNDNNRIIGNNYSDEYTLEGDKDSFKANMSERIMLYDNKNNNNNTLKNVGPMGWKTQVQKQTIVYDKILKPFIFEDEQMAKQEESVKQKEKEHDTLEKEKGKEEKEKEQEQKQKQKDEKQQNKYDKTNVEEIDKKKLEKGTNDKTLNDIFKWGENKNNILYKSLKDENHMKEKHDVLESTSRIVSREDILSKKEMLSTDLKNDSFEKLGIIQQENIQKGGEFEGTTTGRCQFNNLQNNFYTPDIISFMSNKITEMTENEKCLNANTINQYMLNNESINVANLTDIFLYNKAQNPIQFANNNISNIQADNNYNNNNNNNDDQKNIINNEAKLSEFQLYYNNSMQHANDIIFNSMQRKEIEQDIGKRTEIGMAAGARAGPGREQGIWNKMDMGMGMGMDMKMGRERGIQTDMQRGHDKVKDYIPIRHEQNIFPGTKQKCRDVDSGFKKIENCDRSPRTSRNFFNQRIQNIDKEKNQHNDYFKKTNFFNRNRRRTEKIGVNTEFENQNIKTNSNTNANTKYENFMLWDNLMQNAEKNTSKEASGGKNEPNKNMSIRRKTEDPIPVHLDLTCFPPTTNVKNKSFFEEISELKQFIERSNAKETNAKEINAKRTNS